jgi:large subunit ribosomal protein L10
MAKLGKTPTKRRGRTPKVEVVAELEKMFRAGDGFVFFENHGLSVKQVSDLRDRLRENKVAVKVAKNTLIRIALKNAGYEIADLDPKLVGPTVVAVGLEDPISPAKGLVKFMKDNDTARMALKAGILGEKVLDEKGVESVAKMPGREEMLAALVGSLNAPAQNMAYGLNAAVSQFAWALSAYQRQLEEAA